MNIPASRRLRHKDYNNAVFCLFSCRKVLLWLSKYQFTKLDYASELEIILGLYESNISDDEAISRVREDRANMPDNISELFAHNSVITVIELPGKERCAILASVLRAVSKLFKKETDDVRLVLVIEETHTFLPKKVG